MSLQTLFALSPSSTDCSDHANVSEAYSQLVMAELAGDEALLAWAKAWARPMTEALRDAPRILSDDFTYRI